MLTINDVIISVPEIENFVSNVPILRLPDSNYMQINDEPYELRLFSFYIPSNDKITFGEYVRSKDLQNDEIKMYENGSSINPLSYHLVNSEIYLLISLLKV